MDHSNREQMSAFYDYQEPFSAECRAFGRLQETGHEELAVPCFGYVLLDEEHERAMMAKCDLNYWSFNGDVDCAGDIDEEMDQRRRFLGKDGRPPPLRCIVKAFGEAIPTDGEDKFQQTTARRVLRDIIKLQKLGIMEIDVEVRQLVDGKLGDFSTAITMPHFITNPELNPNLTPAMIDKMEKKTFEHCVNDYLNFDSMVYSWNDEFGEEKGYMSVEAYPGGQGIGKSMTKTLRPRRGQEFRKPLYTFVDPRRYGWNASLARKQPESPKRKQPERVSKKVRHPARQRRDFRSRLQRLSSRPDIWRYNYEEKDAEWARSTRSRWANAHFVEWTYKDGYIYPLSNTGEDLL